MMRLFGCVVIFCTMLFESALAGDIFAARTLRVGAIVGPGDFQLLDPEDPKKIEQMLGLEVRRAVYAGHPVTPAHLGPPTLVQRNEIVAMAYRAGGLGIRTEGRALTRGGRGEVVEVMNLTSRKTVRAIVIGPRQVEVQR